MTYIHLTILLVTVAVNSLSGDMGNIMSGYGYSDISVCKQGIVGFSHPHVFSTDCNAVTIPDEDDTAYERFGCEYKLWRYKGVYKRCIDNECLNCTDTLGDCLDMGDEYITLVCPYGMKFYGVVILTVVAPLMFVLVISGVVLGALFISSLFVMTFVYTCLGKLVFRALKEKLNNLSSYNENEEEADGCKSRIIKLILKIREFLEQERFTKKKY